MRMRATGAALVGALALTALVVPAAQAGAAEVETKITKVVVNGGKDVVLGTRAEKTVTVSLTATHPDGIEQGRLYLWHDDGTGKADNIVFGNEDWGTCTEIDDTTSICKQTITFDPLLTPGRNEHAGTWRVSAWAMAPGGQDTRDETKTVRIQRASKLTVNAGPEPVTKGRKITTTGKLTRANWDEGSYKGYTNQPVKLQFRKAGTSTYTTVKTVRTNSTGNLSTTVTASKDGYWRWSFAGTTTTPAVNTTGDYVDVR
ncbi:calcium-binding protein [Streptomyces sp. NBC_00390]|uniref:calcium-binding protein n=1 Tax=Streptomyces sp. NBC_00390 TaxID=2975736 RepID=UPI002E1DCB28